MLHHMFVFGVVIPTIITIIMFIGFLICWFKFNLHERLFKKQNKCSKLAMGVHESRVQESTSCRRKNRTSQNTDDMDKDDRSDLPPPNPLGSTCLYPSHGIDTGEDTVSIEDPEAALCSHAVALDQSQGYAAEDCSLMSHSQFQSQSQVASSDVDVSHCVSHAECDAQTVGDNTQMNTVTCDESSSGDVCLGKPEGRNVGWSKHNEPTQFTQAPVFSCNQVAQTFHFPAPGNSGDAKQSFLAGKTVEQLDSPQEGEYGHFIHPSEILRHKLGTQKGYSLTGKCSLQPLTGCSLHSDIEHHDPVFAGTFVNPRLLTASD